MNTFDWQKLAIDENKFNLKEMFVKVLSNINGMVNHLFQVKLVIKISVKIKRNLFRQYRNEIHNFLKN